MIFETMSDHELYSTMVWINAIMWIFFMIFAVVTLTRYIKRKAKLALFLSLNYFIYIIGLSLLQIGYSDVIRKNEKTDLYFFMTAAFLICVVIGSIMLYLFYDAISKIPQKRKQIVLILGIFLVIWILLPFNNWNRTGEEGFQFKYLTYTLMVLYCGYVYMDIAHTFLGMAKQVPENRNSVISIGVGALIYAVYFLFITIYGMAQIYSLLIIGMMMIFVAQALFFTGFILPSLKGKQKEQ